jgi:hypothetical protein
MIDRRCVGKNVVFVATMDFDRNPQRMQHIASRLARVNNVIYVESPFSLIGLIRNGRNEFSKVIRFIRGSRQR